MKKYLYLIIVVIIFLSFIQLWIRFDFLNWDKNDIRSYSNSIEYQIQQYFIDSICLPPQDFFNLYLKEKDNGIYYYNFSGSKFNRIEIFDSNLVVYNKGLLRINSCRINYKRIGNLSIFNDINPFINIKVLDISMNKFFINTIKEPIFSVSDSIIYGNDYKNYKRIIRNIDSVFYKENYNILSFEDLFLKPGEMPYQIILEGSLGDDDQFKWNLIASNSTNLNLVNDYLSFVGKELRKFVIDNNVEKAFLPLFIIQKEQVDIASPAPRSL